jgi:hypothetical protein
LEATVVIIEPKKFFGTFKALVSADGSIIDTDPEGSGHPMVYGRVGPYFETNARHDGLKVITVAIIEVDRNAIMTPLDDATQCQ